MNRISVLLQLLDANRFQRDAHESARAIGGFGARSFAAASLVAVLSQATGVLSLATIGLASSLAPVLGLLGAVPALGALAGQGLGVAALGFAGVTDALGGLNEEIDVDKLAVLSGSAQDFVLELDKMKAPIRDLQADIQDGMLPGLTRGLGEAKPLLDALRGPLAGTGTVIGDIGAKLGALVGSAGFLADLRSQAQFNNVQLIRLGDAGLHVVNIFRNLMVGSRGLVEWLIKLVGGWTRTADTAISAARESGRLEEIFNTVRITTQRVLLILWRFGDALFNIGRISKREIGDGLLVSLLQSVTALQKWTESEEGIRQIGDAFVWARETAASVRDVFNDIRAEAGPGLGEFFRNLLDAMNPILASGGFGVVLGMYASGLNSVVRAIIWGNENIPGFTFAMSALFAVLVINKITGIGTLAINIMSLARAAFIAAAGTRIFYTAFWALNAAMAANPIGLIIVGIAALVAGLVWAYNNVGWFRDAVNSAFGGIKSAVYAVGDVMKTVFSFGWVDDAAKGAVNGMLYLFNAGIDLINSITPGPIKIAGETIVPAIPDIPHIPMLATGGIFRQPGLGIVGDDGPELYSFPRGGRVDPLPAPTGQLREALGDFDTRRDAKQEWHLFIDGREVALTVKRHAETAKARA